MDRFKELDSSTPIKPGKPLKFISDENLSPSEVGYNKSYGEAWKEIKTKKRTILDMVIDAIKAIGVPKKGASYQTIKKWITVNTDADPASLKYSLKVAVKKGLDKGILLRPRQSASVVGARGFFILPLTKPLKISKKGIKNPVVPSNSKVAKEKTKVPTQGTKVATQKPEVKKKTVTKAPSKVVPGKKTLSNAKAEVDKKPARKVIVKAGKKSVTKVPSKIDAGKKPVTKVPSKIYAGKKQTKQPSNAKTVAGKITTKKGHSNAKAGEKQTTNIPSKVKASELDSNDVSSTENEILFSDFQSDGLTNAKVIKAPKKEKINTKAPAKNKDEVSETIINEVKNGKRNVAKSNKIKTVDKKKPSEKVERQELSDTEITIKKNRVNTLKSFSSDTELEVSKKEEKVPKKAFKKFSLKSKRVLKV